MVELYEVLPQPLTPAGLLLGSGTNATVSSFQPLPLEVGHSRRTCDQARPGTCLLSRRLTSVVLQHSRDRNVWQCSRLTACGQCQGEAASTRSFQDQVQRPQDSSVAQT